MTLWHLVNDLIRFEIELYNALDSRLRTALDLTLARFETMQVLAAGPCRVQDVAEALVITVGGASKMVDRVESSGHCLRRANPDDRRSSLIELTPIGRQTLTAATAIVETELGHRLGEAVPARTLREFGRTLRSLREHEVRSHEARSYEARSHEARSHEAKEHR